MNCKPTLVTTKHLPKSTYYLTTVQQAELYKLKASIHDHHEASEKFVKCSKDNSRQALAEAMLCGHALLKAKEILKHGRFMKWLSEHIKCSQQTANRYMKLATNYSHVSNLSTTGLRKAYIELGIIDEPVVVADSNVETSPQEKHTIIPIKKPAAKTGAQPVIQAVNPTISVDDVMSRPRFLVKELISDLRNKKQFLNHDMKQLVIGPH